MAKGDVVEMDHSVEMRFFNWLKRNKSESGGAALGLTDADDALDPFNPYPEPIQLPLTDVIDLHTISPRDVKLAVEEYLIEAYAAGFTVLRIIHGKGVGVQRETVRAILARTDFVERWTDAPPEAGGLGATIVFLRKVSQRSRDHHPGGVRCL
jgi:hypothetical protein